MRSTPIRPSVLLAACAELRSGITTTSPARTYFGSCKRLRGARIIGQRQAASRLIGSWRSLCATSRMWFLRLLAAELGRLTRGGLGPFPEFDLGLDQFNFPGQSWGGSELMLREQIGQHLL